MSFVLYFLCRNVHYACFNCIQSKVRADHALCPPIYLNLKIRNKIYRQRAKQKQHKHENTNLVCKVSDILKQCTSEDLKKMKGWLEGALPDSKLQKVQEPYELFSLMVEAKLLTPDKLYHLVTPLSSAGRQDLRQQLEGERTKSTFRTTLCPAILAIRKATS